MADLSANARDRILYEVFGRTTNVPIDLDDGGVWEGYIDHAKRRVDEIRKWYSSANIGDTYLDEAVGDDSWTELIELEVTERLIRQFRSVQDAANFRQSAIASLLGQIVSTVSRDWSSNFGSNENTTPYSLRQSVIDILLHQDTPIFPSLTEIDKAIYEEHAMLWDSRHWRFRRKPTWFEIATTGNVTVAGTSATFDGIASKIIYIKGTNNVVTECHWQDSTRWAHLMASFANETTTGRPKYFYLIPKGDSTSIQWLPEPDAVYQGFAVVYDEAPSLGSGSNSSGFGHWPISFRMHLRDRIVARALLLYGEEDNAKLWAAKVEKDYLSLLAEFDDTGSNEWNAAYFRPARFQKEFRSFNGRFMGGMG
jgi:hypothetical protein